MSDTGTGYRVAPLFVIRSTGVPFEVLESIATPATSALARELLACRAELSATAATVAVAIERSESLSPARRHQLHRQITKHAVIADGPSELAEYQRLALSVRDIEQRLGPLLTREYEASRHHIYREAAAQLPDMAVLQRKTAELASMLEVSARPARSDARKKKLWDDRGLAVWLQRVCAKNDTISRFGPSCWGFIEPDEPGVRLAPAPGIAKRVAQVERWVVLELINVINADPEVRVEVAPRLNPSCELVADRVRFHDTGTELALTEDDRALVARCDGQTPGYRLGPSGALADLVERGVIVWKLEPIFADQEPLATLSADVAGWRDNPTRERWSRELESLAGLAAEYVSAIQADDREAVIERVQRRLAELGITPRQRTGRLYEATNSIVENCSRVGDFVVGQRALDELVADATPWFDLFRDANSIASLAIYATLRELYIKAPRHHGRLSLAAFMAFAEASKLDLREATLGRIANETYPEIRARFARQLSARPDAREWELAAEDCRFLAHANVPRPDLAYPTADLQIAARSQADVARGDYQWVVSELHHDFALMGRALTSSCPDRAQLAAQLREAHLGEPALYYDTAGSLFGPVHVNNESAIDALDANVASAWRTKPQWHGFAPADVDVVLIEDRFDVRARSRTSRDLGTLFPLPRFALHPFFPLQLDHHTPRLRRGRTVLQRETWMVGTDELGGPWSGVSSQLVVAVERLRAARGIPRWVYLRLREEELSLADDDNRFNDSKPLCIDLESYALIEVFARRLAKYGKVELMEMLPGPEQLVWQEADGHRCFELRTMLVPAAPTR